jgi:hypothetical protein
MAWYRHFDKKKEKSGGVKLVLRDQIMAFAISLILLFIIYLRVKITYSFFTNFHRMNKLSKSRNNSQQTRKLEVII